MASESAPTRHLHTTTLGKLLISLAAAVLALLSLPSFTTYARAQSVVQQFYAECGAGLAVNPATNRLYSIGSHTSTADPWSPELATNFFEVLDAATGQLVFNRTLEYGSGGIAVNPVTNRVYYSNSAYYTVEPPTDDNPWPSIVSEPWHTVSVVDGATNNIIADINVGSGPGPIAINAVTNKVYVGNISDGTVSVIDGATDRVTDNLQLGTGKYAGGDIAVNANTNQVYVGSADPYFPNCVPWIVDGATDKATATLPSNGYRIAVNPITNTIYEIDADAHMVSVYNGATHVFVTGIGLGDAGQGLAVNPAKNRVYATAGSSLWTTGSFLVIDGSTNRVVETLGGVVSGNIAFSQDTGKIYVSGSYSISVIYDGPSVRTSRTWGTGSVGVSKPATSWFLDEGCTAGGFETWILIQNPGDAAAHVQLTYMTPAGTARGPSATIGAGSRLSFNVAASVADAWSVSTEVTSDLPVVAERSMYGPGRAWGTDSIGAEAASKSWYMAEGCTAGGFETWILLQNPGGTSATARLNYVTENGEKAGPTVTVPARSRITVNAADTVPTDFNVSTEVTSSAPIVAERSTYWGNRKGATDSIGVTAPDTKWFIAEGCTAEGFETWVLLMNPGDSPAKVNLEYMTEHGIVHGPQVEVPAHSRAPINVADVVPNEFSVSTQVTSDKPVVAERSVYWSKRTEGQSSIGVTESSTTWFLAEGSTRPGFETWVVVQNPNNATADVSLTYMTPTGSVNGPSVTLAPFSRKTFNVGDTVSSTDSVSTMVTGSIPVVAERAVYGDPR